MVDKLKLVSIQTLKATKVAVKWADRKLKMADPLMEERIITEKKWSNPNSGRYNISQSGNKKQENLPKQGILTA